MADTDRLIRLKEVLTLIPLSRSTIYERMAKGTFPQSLNLGGGVVAWRLSELVDWINNLPRVAPAAKLEDERP